MGGYVVKHSRPKSKIIDALIPQIVAKAEVAVEEVRPTIHRRSGRLQDSLHVEPTSWGAQVVFGDEENPEKAANYEFGNLSGQDGERPLLHIRQRIERG